MSASIKQTLELHSSDLADLRRSGLSDTTIASMGCCSAEAKIIRMRTGLDKLTSAGYCIPYAGITDQTGSPYLRWRLREPSEEMRYASGRGDDAQLYIPPALAALPPADLLVVTEGEKKAAKAVQEGIHCVGVQGVWAWCDPDGRAAEKLRDEPVNDDTAPLPALVNIAKGYKRVLVLGDSDLLSKPQALAGIKRLSRSLLSLHIRAAVSCCPPVTVSEGGEKRIKKQGLDDWLIADRFHALRSLPALFRAAEVNRDGITDNYNAIQFAEEFRDRLAYTQGGWRWWNGAIWAIDDCWKRRAFVPGISGTYLSAADHLDALLNIIAAPYRGTKKAELPKEITAWTGPVESAVKELQSAAQKISNLRGIDAALALAQSCLRVPDDAWNRDPYLLAARNGVIDLRTSELLPALPAQRITRCVRTDYDPDATAAKFIRFLQRVQPSNEVREYLQCLAGYSAIGLSNEQKFITFVGRGQNGKGTFMGLLMDALGDYAAKGPQGLLAEQSPDRPRNDLATLAGARLVSISETSENLRLDEAMIKSITGDDPVTCRFLNHEFFTYRPCFTPILDTNHPPRPRDPGLAIWRRLVIVPWGVTIPEVERDLELRTRLLEELPGILTWIVQGARKYLENGLLAPPKIAEATQYLRSSCDDIGNWLESCIDLAPQYRAQSSVLYNHFLTWSVAEGISRPLSQISFTSALRARGYDKSKSNGKKMWIGLKLRDPSDASDEAQDQVQARKECKPPTSLEPTVEPVSRLAIAELALSSSAADRLTGGGYAI